MKCISNSLIRWGSALALWLTASGSYGQTVHIAHCLERCPTLSNASNEVVVRHLFVAAIEPETYLAEWVAYRVVPDAVGVASLLPRYWQVDNLLQATQQVDTDIGSSPRLIQPDLSNAQDRDYRISEFTLNLEDRGRHTPMTSFAGTPYWSELNNLSNMAPIPTDLRVGAWARLEQAINELAASEGELYVVSGPIYDGIIGPTSIPSAYFKVINTGNRLAAFVFDKGLEQHASFCAQQGSLEAIEAEIGLRLFPANRQRVATDLAGALGCVNE